MTFPDFYVINIYNVGLNLLKIFTGGVLKINIKVIENYDYEFLNDLEDLEAQNFVESGLRAWELVPIIEHGKLVVLFDEDENAIGLLEMILDWEQKDSAYIYGLSIKKEYRNQGWGTKLLKFGLNYLLKENINKAELTVDPDNKVAVHLYKEKLGFDITNYKENFYGKDKDRYYMTLKLSNYEKQKLKIAS